MTQFVEQLRNQAKWYAQPGHNARDLMDSHLLEKAADEIERLRAKVTEMEQQEPVAKVRVHQTGGNAGLAWSVAPLNDFDSLPLMRDGDRLYALPGAQPAPSVPEGFAIVNAAHFLAVLDREDWRTAKNRAELRAMLAAAPEAKP